MHFKLNFRSSRSPLRSSSPMKSRYSWHLHDQRKDVKTKPKIPPKPRSCSADSSSKKSRISCDVSNLSSNNGPSLQVVGTKSLFSREKVDIQPVIKPSVLNDPNQGPKSRKIVRSRQILKELQRQVKLEITFRRVISAQIHLPNRVKMDFAYIR